jgi:predicted nucleic acid-binding protein
MAHQMRANDCSRCTTKAFEISQAQNIYAYDAYLIQCAQQTNTSLLTLDKGLNAVAEKMGVPLLRPGQ